MVKSSGRGTTNPKITRKNRALKGYTKSLEIEIINSEEVLNQLRYTRAGIRKLLESELEVMKGLKFAETLKVTFEKGIDDDKTVIKTAYFNCKVKTIINKADIRESIQSSQAEIIHRIDEWLSEGSGWVIESIDGHYINIVKYRPLRGNSYIKLPLELQNASKGLINIKNDDDECFRWCHLAHKFPVTTHPERVSKYKHVKRELNYSNVDFPVDTKDYSKIENQNAININVFGYEDKQIYPIHISKRNNKDVLDLLLITENKKRHYVYIKDFNRFMYNQTKHRGRKHFCMHCLQCFSSDRVLESHKEVCVVVNGKQAIKMPEEGSTLKYENFQKQLDVPFVIYADFEAITEKVSGCTQDDGKSYTEKYQKHTDCGYGYKVVCCYDDKFSKPLELYRGEGAVNKFMKRMLEEVKYCKKIKREHFNQDMIMTRDDKNDFITAKKCHICDGEYAETDIKVRDHCHVTGMYRGSAHQACNVNFKLTDKIPVIFHNLRGYDSHFIMQEIGKFNMDINVIPNNMEKYMAFMLGKHLVFLDSFQFMSSSLDSLVGNLPDDSFKLTSECFKGDKLKLMKKKGVYPYDYMDSFEKFEDDLLPAKNEFYSILNDTHISDELYNHAQKIWKEFEIETMGQYHDMYLKCDVLLLADVFENFRKTCKQYYKLDPCHYFTSPGLAWDAMLKMTKVELELMCDIDMFQFIEKGMRGGVSCITHRHSKANNPYMKLYDEKAPSKYIMYLDANNLYGWAMCQHLPTGGFKWLTNKQINTIDLAKYNDESNKGLILEVDLEYPKELHDTHNAYPLAPEQLLVSDEMLSNYCKGIKSKFNLPSGIVKKLVPNLMNKIKYVVHYRTLQLYTDLGLKVTQVHRVLEFNQSPWLKQYIDFNTTKRTAAKNAFEKDFFKLLNNSVFGKTMENIRKRVDVRLITNKDQLLKLTSKPTFVSSKIFSDNLVAVHKTKETLTLNRPAYVGMCILDLSKTLMYDFHYNYIQEKYPDGKSTLLLTDTDSLIYEIQTEDVYKDFYKDKKLFDNCDYPEDSQFYFKDNKKVIGKMKDEAAGKIITELVGLRSKMYSYIKEDGSGGKTAKGVKKNVVKKVIKHENYRDVLLNSQQLHHNMKTIRSVNHQLGSYVINKVSLSCFDDKRYISDDGIGSLAYGHHRI